MVLNFKGKILNEAISPSQNHIITEGPNQMHNIFRSLCNFLLVVKEDIKNSRKKLCRLVEKLYFNK